MIYTRTLRATGFVAMLAGTEVVVQLNEELSTRSHAKGDAVGTAVGAADGLPERSGWSLRPQAGFKLRYGTVSNLVDRV